MRPRRRSPFKHFATPTVTGELKRHLRDKHWDIKVTRRIHDLQEQVRKVEPILSQRLGRLPTIRDLADHLNVSDADIRSVHRGRLARQPWSLNYPIASEEGSDELADQIGGLDRDLEAVPDRDALIRAWAILPERLRTLLALRFLDELSQQQIADRVGLSQMHISRLLTRALTTLRRHMAGETDRTWSDRAAALG